MAKEKTTGWRGSRDMWLAAAKAALVDTGVGSVKIQPLATQLKISRTSFYWHFKDREALLDALLDDWETQNTGAFRTACAAYSETITEAVLSLIGMFLDGAPFDPRLDFAIRGWAHRSDAVTRRVIAADEARLDAIRAMFRRFDYPQDSADVRARTVYLTQMGYISLQVSEDLATRLARIESYVEIFSGHRPAALEMARFVAQRQLCQATRAYRDPPG
ncbi:TetR/AcrR family transcriptional regulator [Chachezhania sediminis]|uniref:TetR/AcrR family transcriptional regulator n=1 Tax=Chachezhania sediminis TaxID=2599291 RepID=UPI001E52330F|nr:TetR/AcrR family transcriptional regulator [Chachezhania sediminis]